MEGVAPPARIFGAFRRISALSLTQPVDPNRPTFPLPPEELRKEKIRAFLTSKQVWLPFVLLAAIGGLVEAPVWALIPILVLAFFVLALIWQARSGRLLGRITERIVRKSNREQDAALVARIRGFSEGREDGYAVTLGKFLEAKQAIEARLHADEKPVPPGGEEIESLVDAITLGAADQFDAVLGLEQQIRALDSGRRDDLRLLRGRQKQHLTLVIEAYKVVKSAHADLDLLVASARPEAPPAPAPASGGNEFELHVSQLREEIRLAIEGRGRTTPGLP